MTDPAMGHAVLVAEVLTLTARTGLLLLILFLWQNIHTASAKNGAIFSRLQWLVLSGGLWIAWRWPGEAVEMLGQGPALYDRLHDWEFVPILLLILTLYRFSQTLLDYAP